MLALGFLGLLHHNVVHLSVLESELGQEKPEVSSRHLCRQLTEEMEARLLENINKSINVLINLPFVRVDCLELLDVGVGDGDRRPPARNAREGGMGRLGLLFVHRILIMAWKDGNSMQLG